MAYCMVEQLMPERGFLVVMLGDAKIHSPEDVVNMVVERLNCPFNLLSDSDTVVDELVDRVRAGYILIVHRLRKPVIDPVKLGLNHKDYEAQYTRPVLVWLGLPNGKPVRLGKLLRGFLGFRGHACQASALVINQVLEKLGIQGVVVA